MRSLPSLILSLLLVFSAQGAEQTPLSLSKEPPSPTPIRPPSNRAAFTNNDAIVVEASRFLSAPQASPAKASAVAQLETVPFVTVRRQGLLDAQSDLSVRGGAFNTSGLLLQGLAIRNPQTEHFQGDLDLPATYFEAPRIATGLDRFSKSAGNPSGSVLLELAPIETAGALTLGGGEAHYRTARIQQGLAQIPQAPGLKLAFFAAADTVDRTDRQPDNDLERWSGGGRGQYILGEGLIDLLLSTSRRTFGARGFYGTPLTQPSEESVASHLALLSYSRGDREAADYERISTALNRVADDYWYYGREAGAASSHRSTLAALHADVSRPLTPTLALLLRSDLALERIRSRTLGDHQRSALSLAALPTWRNGPWALTAGGSVECFQNDHPGWLPAAGVIYTLSSHHRLQVNYSEAIRQPSYTELNYNNPTSLGNQGLERQQTRTAEVGWRGSWPTAEAGLGLFAEYAENSVDWLRLTSEETTFKAVNIDTLRRYGATGDVTLQAAHNLDLRLSGLVQTQNSDIDYYASRYVLDALRYEIRSEILWQVTPDWNVRLWQNLRRMAENPLRDSGRTQRLLGSEVQWQTPWARDLTLTLGVANLLNDDFEVFVGQPQADRRFYALAEYRW